MSRKSLFSRIRTLLRVRKHNDYLDQHGFYDSFDNRKYADSIGIYPFLPYSLTDLLVRRQITDANALVASHRSNAVWFARRGARVTIGRYWHSRFRDAKIRQIDDIANYSGEPVDLLIWDSPRLPTNWEKLIGFLSPRGVVILVYESYYSAMDNGFNALGDLLASRGMRSLEFHNPGPRHEIMCAELYYPRENILNI